MAKHSALNRANGVRFPADPRERSLRSCSLTTEEEHMAAGTLIPPLPRKLSW